VLANGAFFFGGGGGVREISESDYQLRHACPSVRPYGTTRLPVNGFSSNLVFEDFSKDCLDNSSFIKMRLE
jgi:hypothetical protein